MPRSSCAQIALLCSAALLAFSSQPRPAAAFITVTSSGATPIAPSVTRPRAPWDNGDSDIEDEDSPARQTWEQTWTVASHLSLLTDKDEISEVKLSIPGRVFLSIADGQAPLAKVRFSGDSAETMNAFEVVSSGNGVLEIRERSNLPTDNSKGYLLVEVALAQFQKLKTLTAISSADVVVGNNVLAAYSPSDTVSIVTRGSGDVFIHDTLEFNIQQLEFTIMGSGDIELSTTQVMVQTLSTTIRGSGDLRLFTDWVQANEISFALAGSGDAHVKASGFLSDTVVVKSSGSGDVSLYPSGKCTSEEISLSGSGDAYLGSIACVQATVKVSGAGDAFVQASQSLDGHVSEGGDVYYVGQKPARMASKSTSKKGPKPMATASHNKYEDAAMSELPERKPARLSKEYFVDGITDISVLVPLVIAALLAACFIRHEIKKQNVQEKRMQAQEMQPLVQAQVYV